MHENTLPGYQLQGLALFWITNSRRRERTLYMIAIKKSTLYWTKCQVENAHQKREFLMNFLCKMGYTNVPITV